MDRTDLLKTIEHEAATGKPAPKDLNPPETMLYYMLFGIYSSYQAGKIDKAKGHELKTAAYNTYHKFLAEYTQFVEISKEYQRRLREGYSIEGITIIPKEDNQKDESKSNKLH